MTMISGWLHVFPEGKVNYEREPAVLPFRWGLGRLIMDSERLPVVVPIYHIGIHILLHDILFY